MTNFAKRTIIGVLGIPVLLGLIYLKGIYFLIFILGINIVGLWELYRLFEKKNFYPLKLLSIVLSCVLIIIYYLREPYLVYFVILSVTVIVSVEVFRKVRHNPINSFISIFGFVYITASVIFLNELIKEPAYNAVIYIIVLIWACDIFAYFGGKFFGKHQLSPISPKKTWEGAISGFIMTIVSSLLLKYFYADSISVLDAVMLGIIVGVLGQVGDLFESFLKRFAGVKDSSAIIPGHGGILDRFDSLLFSAPICYVYLYYARHFLN